MTEEDIKNLLEWDKNKIIAQEVLPNGKFLSTVILPRILGHKDGFETMLFDNKEDMNDLGCWKWDSKEEALKGHIEIAEEQRHEQLTIELSGLGVQNE